MHHLSVDLDFSASGVLYKLEIVLYILEQKKNEYI